MRTVLLKGSYRDRQLKANALKCDCYVEHHFNALQYDKPGSQDNPSLVLVANNASKKSKEVGALYSQKISKFFGVPDSGVIVRDPGETGYWNLFYTRMPAILVEPLYISDPDHTEMVKSEEGQDALATILLETLTESFGENALIGFSIGHEGHRAGDKGAPARNAAGKIVAWESDLARAVILRLVEKTKCSQKTDTE